VTQFVLYQVPAIAWIALIFWLSSIPSLPTLRLFSFQDKVAHAIVFFFLCWFAHRAFFYQIRFPSLQRRALLVGLAVTILYGVMDEVHQFFVPGRSFDYFDMLADTLGGLAYVGIFLLLDAHWKRRKRVAMLPDGLG